MVNQTKCSQIIEQLARQDERVIAEFERHMILRILQTMRAQDDWGFTQIVQLISHLVGHGREECGGVARTVAHVLINTLRQVCKGQLDIRRDFRLYERSFFLCNKIQGSHSQPSLEFLCIMIL